jgi:hypothetical protein
MTDKPDGSLENGGQKLLDRIRADLARRAAQPSITAEEMDRRIAEWRAQRDCKRPEQA